MIEKDDFLLIAGLAYDTIVRQFGTYTDRPGDFLHRGDLENRQLLALNLALNVMDIGEEATDQPLIMPLPVPPGFRSWLYFMNGREYIGIDTSLMPTSPFAMSRPHDPELLKEAQVIRSILKECAHKILHNHTSEEQDAKDERKGFAQPVSADADAAAWVFTMAGLSLVLADAVEITRNDVSKDYPFGRDEGASYIL